MYEKIGASSAGVLSSCCISGGLREKTMDAGREPDPSPLEEAPTGDKSDGGEGVSGDGVAHLGGVSEGVAELDFLLSRSESFLGPKVDMKEKTGRNARDTRSAQMN
jgi:hypothetical protein